MFNLFSFINNAKAQGDLLPITTIKTVPGTTFGNVNQVVLAAANWILVITSALAIIAIVYSGIMYITAGGDQEKAVKAKKNLLWAMIGIFVILLSFALINYLPNLITRGRP